MDSPNNTLVVAMRKAITMLNRGEVQLADDLLRDALHQVMTEEDAKHRQKIDRALKEHAAMMQMLEAMRDD